VQIAMERAGVDDRQARLRELDHGVRQQLGLRGPAPVDRRLVDAGARGDVLHAHRDVADAAQLLERCSDDAVHHTGSAAARPRLSGPSRLSGAV
jgi:hypothetical protein